MLAKLMEYKLPPMKNCAVCQLKYRMVHTTFFYTFVTLADQAPPFPLPKAATSVHHNLVKRPANCMNILMVICDSRGGSYSHADSTANQSRQPA